MSIFTLIIYTWSVYFRYSPSEKHTVKTFKIKGFHVLEKESNATTVVLKHVTRAISGKFSCEVTTDQPGFLTDMKTATMEVNLNILYILSTLINDCSYNLRGLICYSARSTLLMSYKCASTNHRICQNKKVTNDIN